MKALTLLLLFIASVVHAQDYVGTFDAVPPPGLAKDASHMKAWEMTRLRIEILPDRLIWTLGSISPPQSDINYTVHGQFLLATFDRDGETYYKPIYIHDKDTIFADANKLIRVSGHVQEK